MNRWSFFLGILESFWNDNIDFSEIKKLKALNRIYFLLNRKIVECVEF